MAQGMKRLGMPVAAFFGVVLVGLIATSWFLNRDALQKAVEAIQATGAVLRGVVLWSAPEPVLADVRAEKAIGRDEPAVEVEGATA